MELFAMVLRLQSLGLQRILLRAAHGLKGDGAGFDKRFEKAVEPLASLSGEPFENLRQMEDVMRQFLRAERSRLFR